MKATIIIITIRVILASLRATFIAILPVAFKEFFKIINHQAQLDEYNVLKEVIKVSNTKAFAKNLIDLLVYEAVTLPLM